MDLALQKLTGQWGNSEATHFCLRLCGELSVDSPVAQRGGVGEGAFGGQES